MDIRDKLTALVAVEVRKILKEELAPLIREIVLKEVASQMSTVLDIPEMDEGLTSYLAKEFGFAEIVQDAATAPVNGDSGVSYINSTRTAGETGAKRYSAAFKESTVKDALKLIGSGSSRSAAAKIVAESAEIPVHTLIYWIRTAEKDKLCKKTRAPIKQEDLNRQRQKSENLKKFGHKSCVRCNLPKPPRWIDESGICSTCRKQMAEEPKVVKCSACGKPKRILEEDGRCKACHKGEVGPVKEVKVVTLRADHPVPKYVPEIFQLFGLGRFTLHDLSQHSELSVDGAKRILQGLSSRGWAFEESAHVSPLKNTWKLTIKNEHLWVNGHACPSVIDISCRRKRSFVLEQEAVDTCVVYKNKGDLHEDYVVYLCTSGPHWHIGEDRYKENTDDNH